MYILFVLLLSARTPIELRTQEFQTEVACIKAIGELLELEKGNNSKIRAICVKK